MTGCEGCESDDVFVDDASEWCSELPAERLCRPCLLGADE